MKKKRKSYSEEFKKEAVELHLNTGRSISDIASSLGIQHYLLSRWKKEYLSKGNPFPGKGNMSDEILKLKKEIADLKMENEILKKATAIFSRQTK